MCILSNRIVFIVFLSWSTIDYCTVKHCSKTELNTTVKQKRNLQESQSSIEKTEFHLRYEVKKLMVFRKPTLSLTASAFLASFFFFKNTQPKNILILPFFHDTVPTKTNVILIYIAAQWDLFSLESCHGNKGIFKNKNPTSPWFQV